MKLEYDEGTRQFHFNPEWDTQRSPEELEKPKFKPVPRSKVGTKEDPLAWKISGSNLMRFTDNYLDGYITISYHKPTKSIMIQVVKQTRFEEQRRSKTEDKTLRAKNMDEVGNALVNEYKDSMYPIPFSMIMEFIKVNRI